MMGRHELREHIFELLFRAEFHETEDMPEQMNLFFEELPELNGKDRTYMESKYSQVTERIPEIDAAIDGVARGWKVSRMGKADLSILRLAVYEMRYDEDVPVGVAINEAVELAKKFSGDEAPAFVNGILAQLAQ